MTENYFDRELLWPSIIMSRRLCWWFGSDSRKWSLVPPTHQIFQQGLSPRIIVITTMITICNWILHFCLAFTKKAFIPHFSGCLVPNLPSLSNRVNWVNLIIVNRAKVQGREKIPSWRFPIDTAGNWPTSSGHYCSKVLRRLSIDSAGVARIDPLLCYFSRWDHNADQSRFHTTQV